MNGQLPPTDPTLRKHLTRRSSGRLPENLLPETMARLDAAPKTAQRTAPRALRMPRLAWAGAALAAAVVLAVGVALPAMNPRPAGFIAGYPSQRALTTAELAQLLAGPELAPNTAIVATVTIQARTDVCPMNRWPTVGVVEGMESQVCVMGGDLSARLLTQTKSGTFVFRYAAPGVLGLLAEIQPAPSRLAFGVSEDWPVDGSTFLVGGYLGSTAVPCAEETAVPGDPLFPYGYEQCRWSWLSDDGTPAAVRSLPTWSPAAVPAEPTPAPSIDLLGLDGKARHVEAGGARVIDTIPDATTHGVFVVAPVTGPCPGAAPYDSRGCNIWRVLARVPELSLPGPDYTPTPTPSPTPPAQVGPDGLLGPGNEPLTIGEVVDMMRADPDHLAGWTVVMDAPFGSGVSCPDEPSSPCGALKDLRQSRGTWAVRIQSDGLFGVMGEVKKSSSGKLVSSLQEAASESEGYLRVVDAWLNANTACEDAAATPGASGCRLVEKAVLSPDGAGLSAWKVDVQTGAYTAFIGGTDRSPAHGIYLLSPGLLLSRFAPEGWTPAPSVSPPATPIPEPSTTAAGTYVGLIGEGGRPLTVAEFTAAMAADPDHLAGRIAVVKGPVAARYTCFDADSADPSGLPGTCLPTVFDDRPVAPEGYWAVRVGADGTLEVLGEIKMNGTLFVFTVDQVIANKSLKPDDLLIVQGTATPWRLDPCDVPGPCTYWPLLQGTAGQLLPSGTPTWQDLTGQESGPPMTGFFLVRRGSDMVTILSTFDLTYPPD